MREEASAISVFFTKRGVQYIMTARDDQNFYEKKERLLRRVQAGTATQATPAAK